MAREKSPTSTTPKKPRTRKTAASPQKVAPPVFVDPEQRAALIAEAAYFRAQRRGFAPGGEVEDWLAAEAEVDARLLHSAPASKSQPAS